MPQYNHMQYWEEYVSVTQRNSHAWNKQQPKRKLNFVIYLGNMKHTTIYERTQLMCVILTN